ncbi:MAG: 5'-methylthioadenosine/adenosylhomocysteine nucleosidase [Propionibacteriaceae bacterium]|jgi:adenosylhomocysteine nucleosidase|nr:5'-methylthioadenosine/adenosylhomocysteine nucleosidase [Propionibacteriaceae bacterium]
MTGRIGVQVALEAEAAGVVAALEGARTTVRCGRALTSGRLGGREVVVAVSGIGKVAAAVTATLLAGEVEALLVVGTSGGLGAGVDPGDVVVATALLQHDLDARPLFGRWVQPDLGESRFAPTPAVTWALLAAADEVVAAHPGAPTPGGRPPRRQAGLIVSGDAFVNSHEAARRLRQDLPDALACDMESAAVAQVCAMAALPFGVVRTISDRANGQAAVDFGKFLSVAAGLHRDLVVGALTRLTDH